MKNETKTLWLLYNQEPLGIYSTKQRCDLAKRVHEYVTAQPAHIYQLELDYLPHDDYTYYLYQNHTFSR